MAISLYDASVGTYLQLITSTLSVLDKARVFCEENGRSVESLLDDALCDDMFPLSFQLRSVVHHSLGCIKGLEKGLFTPPTPETLTFDELYQRIVDAKTTLEAVEPQSVNGLADNPMMFKMTGVELPFTAENFVMSFSLPNFYFHTSMVYALLRKAGVPIGKVDFLGPMKMG
ncbi:DUF1993 domain-containing protein [Spongiibacter sp. KMU-158]|uniref:DUF1993 domain-containing protein n=1 Tax=Spongiibacter pelagi TaxID=2760804 RepID=A0A927C4W4_9GAMM|nr:DUF1993 domain-containing protein [Spongiibacter pelagi]MBD2859480.1 DUF1993 domain-containing protein [Spongiibacter pelagi]